jgi:cytochrome oxidase assembly protein ShyY1
MPWWGWLIVWFALGCLLALFYGAFINHGKGPKDRR